MEISERTKRGVGKNFPHAFGVTVRPKAERHRGRAPLRSEAEGVAKLEVKYDEIN